MILGIGTDICEIARVQRMIDDHGQKFLDRVFTPVEQALCQGMDKTTPFYAKRYAAKEAVLKAFGTGLAGGITWQDVEIDRYPNGRPFVSLRGAAEQHCAGMAPLHTRAQVHITLSDERTHAIAYVVIEAVVVPDNNG